MRQSLHENLIAVGRVSGTHGIRGQLRLRSYSGNLATLQAVHQVTLRLPDGSCRVYPLSRVTRHGESFLLTLGGFDTINQVLGLVGSELCLCREQLPEPDEDEYYWQDLLGLTVVTDRGQVLGAIGDIMETGANDIYLVHGNGHDYLIPAIGDVVTKVDLATRTMTITPLEGLLEMYEV